MGPVLPPSRVSDQKKLQQKKQPTGMPKDSAKTRGTTIARAGLPLSGSNGGPVRSSGGWEFRWRRTDRGSVFPHSFALTHAAGTHLQ